MLFQMIFARSGPIINTLVDWGWLNEPFDIGNSSSWTHIVIAFLNFLMWFGNTTLLLMSGVMIKAILTYSSKISIGKHGLPLLDKADWNDCLKIDVDCLDGPTKEKLYQEQLKKNHQEYGVPFENDLSESVMNAFLLVYALNEAIELAERGKKDALLRMAEAYRDELSEAIRKSCFINGYYARVLINREKPQNGIRFVGAPGDSLSSVKSLQNGSLYLNSFSWSLLSGVASEDEIAQMLKLVDAYLKTPSGYRLCSEEDLTLTGAKQAATSHYFPGDRENGGVFKHGFLLLFYKQIIRKILPIK